MNRKNVIIADTIDTSAISSMIHGVISFSLGFLGGSDISHFLLGSTVSARLGNQSEIKLIHKICHAVIGIGNPVTIAIRIAIICTNASHIKKSIIFLILSNIQRHSSMAETIVEKLESNKIRSADSLATSVASLTTTPISAFLSAGASFTPSHIIATTSPSSLSEFTIRIFCSGFVLAKSLT